MNNQQYKLQKNVVPGHFVLPWQGTSTAKVWPRQLLLCCKTHYLEAAETWKIAATCTSIIIA
ncbi:hypothetical protein [Pontibacter mangrovi]|uniref:Uncharacterized protein n=1 Tax=Pontibacter mangrovi TaxID=2589816 RepID=A0A501WFC3_9BACT|nr:hypothetical protein [Pontibacter mangrovi]TPE44226.1 hypothetical protein FJM65_08675 [Pontibacter mangrovi]